MLLEELIEKAFSDGYEYALMEQREFNSFSQKMLRRGFDYKSGLKSISTAPKSVQRKLTQNHNEIIGSGRAYNRIGGFTGPNQTPTNIHHKINARAIEKGVHPSGHGF
jgi:hypothetical protein